MTVRKPRSGHAVVEDEDNPEWTEADFARARPADEVLGHEVATALVRRGRPLKAPGERKQQVTMRFAPDLLDEMRASGPGWQARAEAILRREFIDAEVEAVVAAMQAALEGGPLFDILSDEQVRRGMEPHSSRIVRLAIEKLRGERSIAKKRDASTLFERMHAIAGLSSKVQSGRTVIRSSGMLLGRKGKSERKKQA